MGPTPLRGVGGRCDLAQTPERGRSAFGAGHRLLPGAEGAAASVSPEEGHLPPPVETLSYSQRRKKAAGLAKLRLAVLVSGGGTNLQSILDACASGRIDAEVALVLSNAPEAYALERARLAGVPGVCIPAGKRSGTPEWEAADAEQRRRLEEHGVELVCMAGYMRRLGPLVYEAYQGRVLNIHPALLPSFIGAHGQRDAVDYGVRVSGCTVHFADEQFDTGPVIIQAAVPVLPEDDAQSLGARILRQEHRIYPQAIQWYAQGRLHLVGRRVIVSNAPPPTILEAIISPGLDILP